MPAVSPEFSRIFSALREMLRRQAGRLTVKEDSPDCFCLEGGSHPTHKQPMPVAWVQVGKSYVSFHHMGVYARPELLTGVSKELKARMQGKSCFNFTSVTETLFAELEALSARAFDVFRKAPFMQGPKS